MKEFLKKNKLSVTILLSLYIIYMLRYFKTKYNFAHPLTSFDNQYFKHPIGKSSNPESKICKFGRVGVFFLSFFLLGKEIMFKNNCLSKNNYYNISRIVYITVFVLSFANFNALIYLIPFFVIESIYFL